MIDYSFIVPGKITGKGRHRVCQNKYSGKLHAFTPEATANYEDLIRFCYNIHVQNNFPNAYKLLDKPFLIFIYAFFKVPQSYSKKKKELCYNGDLPVNKKPDIDNICKIVLDALNGFAYNDDRTCQLIYCAKFWANAEEGEHLSIRIREMNIK